MQDPSIGSVLSEIRGMSEPEIKIDQGIVQVGEAPSSWGFTAENFSEDSYLWRSPGVVTISFIVAKNIGKGVFSRLVKAIEADGLKVQVPTPLGQMRAILTRWGFKPTMVYDQDSGEHVEEWARA